MPIRATLRLMTGLGAAAPCLDLAEEGEQDYDRDQNALLGRLRRQNTALDHLRRALDRAEADAGMSVGLTAQAG